MLLVAGVAAGAPTAFAAASRGHGLSDTLWNELPQRVPLAVMLIDGAEAPLASLSQEVAEPFGGSASLLLPVFVDSGNFALVFEGYLGALQSSDFGDQAAALLLGRVDVETAHDDSDPALVVVHARCKAKIYRADRSFAFSAFEATGEGVEYSRDRAHAEALIALKTVLVERTRHAVEAP